MSINTTKSEHAKAESIINDPVEIGIPFWRLNIVHHNMEHYHKQNTYST